MASGLFKSQEPESFPKPTVAIHLFGPYHLISSPLGLTVSVLDGVPPFQLTVHKDPSRFTCRLDSPAPRKQRYKAQPTSSRDFLPRKKLQKLGRMCSIRCNLSLGGPEGIEEKANRVHHSNLDSDLLSDGSEFSRGVLSCICVGRAGLAHRVSIIVIIITAE